MPGEPKAPNEVRQGGSSGERGGRNAGTGLQQGEPQQPQTTREKLTALAKGKDTTMSIVAAKATIGGDGRQEEDVLEREAKMQAQSEVTETRNEWARRPEGEELTTRDRVIQTIRRAVPRWWNHSVNQLNTYVRTKEHAHQLLASSGLTMQNIPDGFRTMLSNSAQEFLNNNRDQMRADAQSDRDTRRQTMTRGDRARDSLQELRQRVGRNQRELRTTEVQLMDNLRNSLTRQSEINDPTNTDPAVMALRQFVNNPDNAQLIAAYRGIRSGDFQASQGLAQRLGTDVPAEAIRTALTIGEKRAEVVDQATGERQVKQLEITGPMADFFKNDVIIPMLQEGVANGGQFDADRLIEFQLRIQEKFRSRDFVQWRNGLSPEDQANLDASLSYGTNVIPMVQEVLLPDLLTMKDEMESNGNVNDYINEMVLEDIDLKTTIGTLQSGEQGTIDETRLQQRYARNVEANRLFQQIEAEGDQESAAAYASALNAANERRGVLFPSLASDPNLAGMAAGIGTYFATRALGRTASIFLPGVGAGLVAGTMRGVQERTRFNQEAQYHARQAARGEQFDPEAARRNRMAETEMPMRNIQDSTTTLTDANDRLRRLIDGETTTADGNPIDQNALLESTFGSLVDASVRRNIMDANPTVELYRATDINQPMDPLRTNLELARFQTAATLREYAAQNPQAIQDFAQRLGITDYATATVDTVFDPLQYALRANIMRGAEIGNAMVRSDQEVATIRRTLGTSVDASESIAGRQEALAQARRRAIMTQALGTFAAAEVGSLAIQGLSEAVTGVGNWVGGSKEALPTPSAPPTETTAPPGLHDANLGDKRVRIPDGTTWVENGNGSQNLVVANEPDTVLIQDATIGPDGQLHAESTVDGLTPKIHQEFVNAPTHPVDLPIDGVTVNIPDGLHIQSANGTMELVVDGSNQVLGSVNAAGEITRAPGITPEQLGLTVEPGVIPVEKNVNGPEGLWNEYATTTTEHQYYGNNTEESDGAELRGHTVKQGNKLFIVAEKMGISTQDGLIPPSVDIDQVIADKQLAVGSSLPGDLNHQLVAYARDHIVINGEVYAALALDPTDTDPSHVVDLPNGRTAPLGEYSQMLANLDAYKDLSDGDIATEMNITRPGESGPPHQLREVFNVGGADGSEGEISIGRLAPDPNGDGQVWQSFATMKGSHEVPSTVSTSTPHTTISITKVPQDVLEITGYLPGAEGPGEEIELPSEAPILTWITTPFMPRRPLERGGYQRPTETGIAASEPPAGPENGSEEENRLFGPRVDTILSTLNLPANLYEADGTTPKPEVRDLLTNFLRDKYNIDAGETPETRIQHLDQAADMFSEGYNRFQAQQAGTEAPLTNVTQREPLVNILRDLDLQLSDDELNELVGLYTSGAISGFTSDYESNKAETEKELRFQANLYKAYKEIDALAEADQGRSEAQRNEQNFNRLASQAGLQALRDLNVPGVFEADGTTPKPEAVAIVERLLTQDLRTVLTAEGVDIASTSDLHSEIEETAEMFRNFYTDFQNLQAGNYTPRTAPTPEQRAAFINIFSEGNPQLSDADLTTLADMFGRNAVQDYISQYATDKDTVIAQAKFWGDTLTASKEIYALAQTPEAPQNPGQSDPLVERMRTESTVQITPHTLASYLHNNVGTFMGPGTIVNDFGMEFNNDQLVVSGNFSVNGATVGLNGATFIINDQGQLELDGEIDWEEVTGTDQEKETTVSRLTEVLSDFDNRLKTALSAQLQNGREVAQFAQGDNGELSLLMTAATPAVPPPASLGATRGQTSSSSASSRARGLGQILKQQYRRYKQRQNAEE